MKANNYVTHDSKADTIEDPLETQGTLVLQNRRRKVYLNADIFILSCITR